MIIHLDSVVIFGQLSLQTPQETLWTLPPSLMAVIWLPFEQQIEGFSRASSHTHTPLEYLPQRCPPQEALHMFSFSLKDSPPALSSSAVLLSLSVTHLFLFISLSHFLLPSFLFALRWARPEGVPRELQKAYSLRHTIANAHMHTTRPV